MEKSRGSGLLETPALFMPAEFPRRTLLGNSVNMPARVHPLRKVLCSPLTAQYAQHYTGQEAHTYERPLSS